TAAARERRRISEICMVGSVSFPKIFEGHSLQSLLFMGHGDCRSCELNRKYSCALLVVHRGEKLMRRLQWCRGSWPKRPNNATDRYRRRLHGAKAEGAGRASRADA